MAATVKRDKGIQEPEENKTRIKLVSMTSNPFLKERRGSPYICAVCCVSKLSVIGAVLPAEVDGRPCEIGQHVAHQFGGEGAVKVHPHIVLWWSRFYKRKREDKDRK